MFVSFSILKYFRISGSLLFWIFCSLLEDFCWCCISILCCLLLLLPKHLQNRAFISTALILITRFVSSTLILIGRSWSWPWMYLLIHLCCKRLPLFSPHHCILIYQHLCPSCCMRFNNWWSRLWSINQILSIQLLSCCTALTRRTWFGSVNGFVILVLVGFCVSLFLKRRRRHWILFQRLSNRSIFHWLNKFWWRS